MANSTEQTRGGPGAGQDHGSTGSAHLDSAKRLVMIEARCRWCGREINVPRGSELLCILCRNDPYQTRYCY